ncbi:hypothetical protein J6590_081266 [Homalodisca vitripennis]|nr:hypothetical protein J6590_090494 [Homalodisca vitripennis]KAG8304969.1 hypothetical protein J6590_081266 [Homalodisca vitripennis]
MYSDTAEAVLSHHLRLAAPRPVPAGYTQDIELSSFLSRACLTLLALENKYLYVM